MNQKQAQRTEEITDPDLREIGARLHNLRFRTGKSLEEVEAETGIGASSLSKWERGKVEAGILGLLALCSYYEVTPDWLLTDLRSTRVVRGGEVTDLHLVEGSSSVPSGPVQLPTMAGV